ncbi:hypothetical protein [Smaragdicoccus niigatensis]|uniref:hypothetical protein n=1 Tax=Smaragdicoccus niigatensis TaxID=359359 RepID=UPI00037EDA6C|nr:hypothetical protein [Smaragdicoccus niigatensis]
MEFRTARLGNRVVASMIGAAALATAFGAGTASAAVSGTVAFKTEGTSVSASVDATSSVSGSTVLCKLDVKSQSATSTTKTAYKTAQSGGGVLKQTLKIDDLQPGKYDTTLHCFDNPEDKDGLTKTAVLTVTGATPASTGTGTTTTPTGLSGIFTILQGILSSILGTGTGS